MIFASEYAHFGRIDAAVAGLTQTSGSSLWQEKMTFQGSDEKSSAACDGG